jgi:hypothetical protein
MPCVRRCVALLVALAALNARAAGIPAADIGPPRFTLKQAQLEAAPPRSSRYQIRARFSAVDSAGDLHEGANFVLIGRFAKGGASCSAFTLFSNGFE